MDGMQCKRKTGFCKTPGCFAGWSGDSCNQSTYQQHIYLDIVIKYAYYCKDIFNVKMSEE